MTTFTIDHYLNLDQDKRTVVDKWLRKYSLLDQVVFIEKMLEADYGMTDIRIVAWGISDIAHYKNPTDDPYQIVDEVTQLRVIAEFEFDDFPWEVMA